MFELKLITAEDPRFDKRTVRYDIVHTDTGAVLQGNVQDRHDYAKLICKGMNDAALFLSMQAPAAPEASSLEMTDADVAEIPAEELEAMKKARANERKRAAAAKKKAEAGSDGE